MKKYIASLIFAVSAAGAQAPAVDTTPKIAVGAFIDSYYAYDFNRPANFDRAYTTQPARHNEFNVNLAYVEARLDAQRIRGRFAVQTGTSVQANYSGEPHNGSVSGPEVSRLVQEAVVGLRMADNLWVDGGVFFSHIGMEGFVSRDNLLYTRSLVADFSPYYESGVKLTWQLATTVTATLAVINGWQNISETNAAKSAGVRIDYAPSATTMLSYFNYLGDEAPDTAPHSQVRFYNGIGAKTSISSTITMLAELDYGVQKHASGSGSSSWYGGMLAGRLQASPAVALLARVERYDDRDQVIVVTGVADGLRSSGASIGVDLVPQSRVLWRTEFRGFTGEKAIFLRHSGTPGKSDAFVVSSLALTI